MIRSIIIDDEQHCVRSLLSDLQQNCLSIEVVDTCSSAKEGIMAIKKLNPDLIFLDVEMPWMNGFEMLEVLSETNFSIIFTTAHDEFAAKAFRISAIDYLLKPIDAGDLKAAVQKVEKKMQEGVDLFNKQKFREAIALFNEAVKLNGGGYHQAFKRRNSGTVIFNSSSRVKDFNWNESKNSVAEWAFEIAVFRACARASSA